ncbi:site-specific DNA-methyltransferase [Escherichia coli]|uniref:site-specific DNA-methyltransferase n=1 Tax=Escherichia coli TaxID=562 RepID=UPI000BB80F4A|nr:site-specific DNA-methyltransferase [Escherichia coli]EEY5011696.1 site-specific DNA-methyltransferase [Escherichia coli]EFB6898230.1 site-specific DNA-methyltransferase [Escherichia coli]EHA4557826.1 site-specific DNA-methyltransferase [Escherichia coli]EHR8829709.1 site-specific DNA-methyltransferase [Escherichia coli]EHU9726362.1 site-specific DNA-methyltransferase [Escherichia coli]
MTNKEQTNVEKYEFEPIKGYPMLNWKGKRPFRSTQYFPAQLKEVYGQEDENGWINKIFWGDNLQVMSHLLKKFRGKVKLIYIDPPFDSKADYKKTIKLKNRQVQNDSTSFEEKQYTDIWANDDYLQFIYERIVLLRELLSDDGFIFIHCDWHQSHYIRLMMDEVFGSVNFRNEIIWVRSTNPKGSQHQASKFSVFTDTIHFYSKSENSVIDIDKVRAPLSPDEIAAKYHRKDDIGPFYDAPIIRSLSMGERPSLVYTYKGYTPPASGWRVKLETLQELDKKGNIGWSSNGVPFRKLRPEDDKGKPVGNIWDDISLINSQAAERVGYPTQKPIELLERIILSATEEGDLILDTFMGSGTTMIAAAKNQRKYIGADINLGAIQTTTKRLVKLDSNFEVYNVNNYEIFRNPVEAKDLLIEALEIQKLDSNVVYDGEKDGYKVKIMPINRIATKEDLNELVANFPYKKFEERKAVNPNKPVEEIMLVCMGHEPGLGAVLENECGYKLKVEVVDILRDKSDLTFKYDSEAVIKVHEGKLVVEAFYPRNLLQKLSQQKEDVTEWREMVESIMIDWNYDGAVIEPVVIDIPENNEFVAGEYEIPEGASNIKIKITDLLSESYEEVIAHG